MPHWIEAENGYSLAIDDDKILARNKAGNTLKSVPPAVKKGEIFEQLDQLLDWMATHTREAAAEVARWMNRALPVPVKQVVASWADPAWSKPLTDLVVEVGGRTGFLRSVNIEDHTLGVVTLDGETEWLSAETMTIPHPVQLGADLADYREFAVELGIHQSLSQLMRETYSVEDRDPQATAIDDFADGVFEQLRFLTGRAIGNGFQVQGGYAVTRVWENGDPIEARVWVGSEDPDYETQTGDLVWVKETDVLPLSEVGPVAFSEGMRMAAILYAGRKIETAEAAS